MAMQQQGAKPKVLCKGTNSQGEPCGNTALKGSHFCKSHGGNALKGPEHPKFIHGKYSRYLRRDILDAYLRFREQEDMYTQVEEIALLDARISLLVEGLDNKDGLRLFDNLADIMLDMQEMVKTEEEIKHKDMQMVADRLSSVVSEAKSERRRWQEVYDVMDIRRKLIESDRKRMLEQQEYLTKQQALMMITSVMSIIHNNIEDAAALRTIRAQLDELSRLDIGRWSIAQSGSQRTG